MGDEEYARILRQFDLVISAATADISRSRWPTLINIEALKSV